MRSYEFKTRNKTLIVTEGEDLSLNGRAVTKWEVRELCQPKGAPDYYHQRGDCYLPRSAAKARIEAYVVENYAA